MHEDLNKVFSWIVSTKPDIYELKLKYQVLKEISINKKIYKRGEYVYMHPSTASKLSKGVVNQLSDQSEFHETVSKIKFYLDFKSGFTGAIPLPDIEFSKDFKRIKIYPYDRITDSGEVPQAHME